MLMATKKKKPSKRGKKAKQKSLHCSPMIITQEKKIKNWTKFMKSFAEFVKALIQLSNVIKPLIEWCKSLLEWLLSAL
ncbi:hypothetical protein DW175_07270 [Bacteroides sp. AM16-15]|nr:hypothetical protein DW175_07270 [Bacteroides sp. AM16-15]